jgi:hypothetical protein
MHPLEMQHWQCLLSGLVEQTRDLLTHLRSFLIIFLHLRKGLGSAEGAGHEIGKTKPFLCFPFFPHEKWVKTLAEMAFDWACMVQPAGRPATRPK